MSYFNAETTEIRRGPQRKSKDALFHYPDLVPEKTADLRLRELDETAEPLLRLRRGDAAREIQQSRSVAAIAMNYIGGPGYALAASVVAGSLALLKGALDLRAERKKAEASHSPAITYLARVAGQHGR